jgi:hypothetical protein
MNDTDEWMGAYSLPLQMHPQLFPMPDMYGAAVYQQYGVAA